MTAIGSTSQVILCEGISGSSTSVTYNSSLNYQFIKAKSPKIGIKFNTKVTHTHPHKSRKAPEIKFVQTYTVSGGKTQASDANAITEWILAKYIAKDPIYLLVNIPDKSSWVKKSWYMGLTKVYYLMGNLQNLDIQQEEGRIWKMSFTFEECLVN